ncbi:hypothetical protein LLG46_09745 [bacterium]|nr:hypothetical protein [bacterium]
MANAAASVKERVSDTAHRAKLKAHKAAEKIMDQRRVVDSAMSVPERVSPRIFFGLSIGSILLSLGLFTARRKEDAIFVGHWAPTFLALGLFSRLVSSKERKK